MLQKSKYIFIVFLTTLVFLIGEFAYLRSNNSMTQDALSHKLSFVELSGLPDLAISTEANYVRHRSLSDLFGIYKDDSSLREYFPSTFVISHSHIKKDN